MPAVSCRHRRRSNVSQKQNSGRRAAVRRDASNARRKPRTEAEPPRFGAEVRSSDDKIVGEVRNIVFGTKDGRDYAIVASGGLFTTGMEGIVVPIQSLKVTQDRSSFFLPISKETIKTLPLMPDQDYLWLSDQKWRTHNDAVFKRP